MSLTLVYFFFFYHLGFLLVVLLSIKSATVANVGLFIVKNIRILLILPLWCFPIISPSIHTVRSSVSNIHIFTSFYLAILLSSFSLLQFILKITFHIIFQKCSSYAIIIIIICCKNCHGLLFLEYVSNSLKTAQLNTITTSHMRLSTFKYKMNSR